MNDRFEFNTSDILTMQQVLRKIVIGVKGGNWFALICDALRDLVPLYNSKNVN